MPDTVIKVEHLFKEYRIGSIGYGTLYSDLQSYWAKLWGREDPNSLIRNASSSPGSLPPVCEAVPERILAVNDVSFQIERGESLGILGRNGAGKSTLLKILSRVVAPTAGKVFIKGKISSLLEIGTGFHPELSGLENIFLNGAILGMKRAEIKRNIDAIVDFSEIGKFINTPVKRYSSGMYIRLAFSIATHFVAETVILDEVLAVGDKFFVQKSMNKIVDITKNQGRTVLFVSHSIPSLQKLCKKGILLDNGRIVATGNINEVVATYEQTPVVRDVA